MTPVIGAEKFTDGLYYWTINRGNEAVTWLLDSAGKMIRTTGDTGGNGVTPRLRINSATNFWEVSYDLGTTWTSLNIKATGDKGEQGDSGTPLIKNIENSNEAYVQTGQPHQILSNLLLASNFDVSHIENRI